eukprot:725065-Rhodomonas_salina.3
MGPYSSAQPEPPVPSGSPGRGNRGAGGCHRNGVRVKPPSQAVSPNGRDSETGRLRLELSLAAPLRAQAPTA